MEQNNPAVRYLCGGEQDGCSKNSCYKKGRNWEKACKYTKDIRHAKNFNKHFPKIENASYWEEE